MANFDAPWEDNNAFDPEIWLQWWVSMAADKGQKDKMVERIVKRTGLSPEKVEVIVAYTMEFMAGKTRCN